MVFIKERIGKMLEYLKEQKKPVYIGQLLMK